MSGPKARAKLPTEKRLNHNILGKQVMRDLFLLKLKSIRLDGGWQINRRRSFPKESLSMEKRRGSSRQSYVADIKIVICRHDQHFFNRGVHLGDLYSGARLAKPVVANVMRSPIDCALTADSHTPTFSSMVALLYR